MAGFESGKRRSPRGSRRTPTVQKRKLDMVDRSSSMTSAEKSEEVSQHSARSFYNKSSANQKQPYIGPLERKYLREIEEKRAQRSRETSSERPTSDSKVSPTATPTPVPAGPRKYIITVPVKNKTVKARQTTPLRKSPRKSSSPTSHAPLRWSPRKAKTPQLKKSSPSLGKVATGITESVPRTPPLSVNEMVYTLTPSLFSDIDGQDTDDTESVASSDVISPTQPAKTTTVESQKDGQKAQNATRMIGSPQRAKTPQQASPKSSPSQRQTKQVTLHAFLKKSPQGKTPGKETQVDSKRSEEVVPELGSEEPGSSEQDELLMAFEELANAPESNVDENAWNDTEMSNIPSVCESEDLFPGYSGGNNAENDGTQKSTAGNEVDWRVGDEVSPSKSSSDSGCGSEVMEESRSSDQSGEPEAKRQKKCWPIFSGSPKPRSRLFNKSSPRSSPLSTGKLKLPRRPKEPQGMEQLIIDAGQKKIGAIVCETCGMLYTVGHADDEAAHQKYHHKFLNSVKFEGWKKEHVLATFHDGRIIMVLPDDPKYAIKKAEEVRELVDNELGFIKGYSTTRSNCKTLLFISNDKRVVGCVIAEQISKAYRVLPNDSQPSPSPSPLRAWCCDTRPVAAVCGISRVWTFRLWRKKKVASRLVDTLRSHFAFGCVLSKDDVAFSDPTPDGRKFAENYCGTAAFLCYK
ncbi:N-acetyltransferase ESCO2-like isoform X2 [Branchiostoma lanceolatum]|uniref:N-acetyltransferase ESCO2-like isoform X2 n=1 Tax=Branchiostoma lanceolatum TaxID=7740 RepID=UPI003455832B